MDKNSDTIKRKIHFGGLDSLRTYAFAIVFISHAYFSFFTITDDRTRHVAHGEVGVQIFFVLSAFLITYLSLQEVKKTGAFSIKNFFKKRILRIWPLYFLALSMSYVWHVVKGSEQAIGCNTQFLYFLGNLCAQHGVPDIIGSTTVTPLWSISVEQQFYIIFPLLLIFLLTFSKYVKKIYIKIFVVSLLSLSLAYALYSRFIHAQDWKYISYATVSSLPGFIAGIILAYYTQNENKFITHIRKNPLAYSIGAILLLICSYYVKFTEDIGVSLYVLPLLISTIIYIVLKTDESTAASPTVYSLTTQYLGKISYGLYVYHMFAIAFIQYLALPVLPIVQSLFALCITIVVAHVSFKYFESWFLKFK